MENKTLIEYELRIYKQPTRWNEKDTFKITEHKVLAQNDKYIVLLNDMFTKLQKKKSSCIDIYSVLNIPTISTKDCLQQDGIFYHLYSTVTKKTSTIERQIKAHLKKHHGWFLSGDIDFSILKTPQNKG